MNKHEIDRLLPAAYDVIENGGFIKDGKIDSAFRGQISSYGSAIANGSLLAATAFFSKQGNASVDRSLLMKAINQLLPQLGVAATGNTLFDTIRNNWGNTPAQHNDFTEKVLICATALKLAFNLFFLEDKNQSKDKKPAEAVQEEVGSES